MNHDIGTQEGGPSALRNGDESLLQGGAGDRSSSNFSITRIMRGYFLDLLDDFGCDTFDLVPDDAAAVSALSRGATGNSYKNKAPAATIRRTTTAAANTHSKKTSQCWPSVSKNNFPLQSSRRPSLLRTHHHSFSSLSSSSWHAATATTPHPGFYHRTASATLSPSSWHATTTTTAHPGFSNKAMETAVQLGQGCNSRSLDGPPCYPARMPQKYSNGSRNGPPCHPKRVPSIQSCSVEAAAGDAKSYER